MPRLRQRETQLVALADVARIGRALERRRRRVETVGRELRAHVASIAARSVFSRSRSTWVDTRNAVRTTSYLRSVVSSPIAELIPG